MDTLSEIQERHDTVKEIERSLLELHQVFLDMAALVEAQGNMLNDIESNVSKASSFVMRGTDQLHGAKVLQRNNRKWACIATILAIVVVIVILFPILFNTLLRP
jgi:syntaxin 1B/2/3